MINFKQKNKNKNNSHVYMNCKTNLEYRPRVGMNDNKHLKH